MKYCRRTRKRKWKCRRGVFIPAPAYKEPTVEEMTVDGKSGPDLSTADAGFELLEEFQVAGGQLGGIFHCRHHSLARAVSNTCGRSPRPGPRSQLCSSLLHNCPGATTWSCWTAPKTSLLGNGSSRLLSNMGGAAMSWSITSLHSCRSGRGKRSPISPAPCPPKIRTWRNRSSKTPTTSTFSP
jgi:hypothetical protein